jgi:ATP-dependent RNA helicase DDX42
VARKISGKGIAVDSIHDDRHQSDRNAAMTSLRKGKITALVATDVASRGLDVTGIMTVINFDPAKNMDSHVHRVGRAGRLSEKTSDNEQQSRGNAYTLLTTKNADFANSLMEAFQREGREVADDLIKLAVTSRHNGGGGRQKWNQSGLGYEDSDRGNNINVGSSHYQPSGKRSRWA